jgi:hypothetical protein
MMKCFFLSFSFCFASLASFAQIVNVSTASQLKNALDAAQPGQTILLADGVYDLSSGIFTPPIGLDGTPTQPITVKGSRNAVLTTGTYITGYAFQFKGNKYWTLKGFTTRNCKNGIMVDSSQYITIDSIQSVYTGQAGINLRRYSSYCTVQNCYVDSAGLIDPAYGEGIYVGSAYSNWCENTYCNVDTCNYNKLYNNSFGNYVLAENIDIKEGTKYGLIRGNTFNGTGLANVNGGDSWVDVKGNYWTIELNTGTGSYLDGFQTHIQQPGWGNYNIFNQNTLNVNASGYGIRITTSNSNGTAFNNVVCNSNIVSNATLGLTNISTQTCSAVLANQLLYWNAEKKNDDVLFTWKLASSSSLQNFIIEQSANGQQFEKLVNVDVSGTDYTIALKQNQVKGNYFRLLLNKKDGSKSYSSIIHLKEFSSSNLKAYKNGNALMLVNPSSTPLQFSLLSVEGKKLFSGIAAIGINSFYPTISSGIYFMEAEGTNLKKQVIKIVW